MTQNYSIGTTITDVFVENTNPVNPTKQGLIFAGRTLPANNLIVPPQSNTPMPNLYVPFRLGAYTTGLQALAALKQMGYVYTLGLEFNTTFVEPDLVTSNSVSGLVTLSWNDPLMGIQYLVGQNPYGSVTQGSAAGTIVSVSIVGDVSNLVLTPVTGSPSFTTSDPIVITAELTDPMPDPAVSDEVCVAAFWFYNQYADSAVFTTSPNLWLSVYVTGRDASISPTATAITLVAPTSAVVQPDDSVNLTYPIAAYQLGLLPTTYLGDTTITQAITLPTDSMNVVYYANGVFLAGSADNAGGIYYSADGVNWAATNITTHTISAFVWNGSVYVATSNVGVYYSVNGSSWTVSNLTSGLFTCVAYGNTKFCAGSSEGIYYSSNGITWVRCTDDGSDAFTVIFNGTGTEGFQWVAATSTGAVYTSTDGITYDVNGLTALTPFTSGLFAGGLFLLTYGAGIVYSTGGVAAWIDTSGDVAHPFISLSYLSETGDYLAGTTSAGIKRSTNGVVWAATSNTASTVKGFATDNTTIVAMTTVGIYKSTDDGVTWELASGSGSTGSYTSVVFAEDIFVAGDTTGISVSADGVTWAGSTASITGVYNGYTLTSTTAVLNIINVAGGVLNNVTPITVVLDVTQNGFEYLGDNQISTYGIGYNITTAASGSNHLIDINSVAHNDFYNGIVALQNPAAAQTNKFHVQGYFSYVAASINGIPLAQLTTPNVVYFKATAKLDVPTLVQYPANAMMVTASMMFNDLNNEYPYYATNGNTAILGVTTSTNQTSYPKLDSLNQLVSQGWTPLGVNSTPQNYIFRNVCTLQSIGNVTDTEYRYEDVQLKTRWLDENLYIVAEGTAIDPATGMRLNNNPELITNMQKNLSAVLVVAYNGGKGIVGNTRNTVTVVLNPADVTRLLITVTTTIVPSNSGSDIVLYIYSFAV